MYSLRLFKFFKGQLPLLRRWQTLEMARSENLNEEDEAEQDGNLAWNGKVGSKQAVRQGNEYEGRDELTQIEGCREQGMTVVAEFLPPLMLAMVFR